MLSFNFPEDLEKINDIDSLVVISRRIRKEIIASVSKNGGHLSSNLGVVESTIALLKVFHEEENSIVWDVGHQCYAYKILTGRDIGSIRTHGGLSGFTSQDESFYDKFNSGHAGNSISLALGLSEFKRCFKESGKVIAFIGDGSMTCGLAYEGLNNASQANNLVVILNDNSMSISKNVGSISKYLSKIRTNTTYLNTKYNVKNWFEKIPHAGKILKGVFSDFKSKLRTLAFRDGSLFENLGFRYYGPIDGHDISSLLNVMNIAKKCNFPILIHIVTKKGKGYIPAEKNSDKFHGVSKFSIDTGCSLNKSVENFSDVFGKFMCNVSLKNDKIYAITAAMKKGTGLEDFSFKFPNRFCDVGIAESHAVSFAAGLSKAGFIPVLAIYSTFLQRSFDQLIHDVSMQNIRVIFAVDRSGFVGEDGQSHHGIFDVSMFNSMPNIICYSPSFFSELSQCLDISLNMEKSVAIRYPRGSEFFKPDWLNKEFNNFDFYGSCKKKLVVTYGRIFSFAAQLLNEFKESFSILKLNRIIPLDNECIVKSCEYDEVIFFEEAYKSGGVADKFSSLILKNGFKGKFSSVSINGFVKHASMMQQLHDSMLDFEGMKKYLNL